MRFIQKGLLALIRIPVNKALRKQSDARGFAGELRQIPVNGNFYTVRYYTSGKEKAPVYFDIHGGGFAWGNTEEGDLYCQQLSRELGLEVYSVDYPFSPKAVYPSQLEWIYGLIRHIHSHAEEFGIDPERMFVGGRSAGGNLSAALCFAAAERKDFSFAGQILDHAALDFSGLLPDEARYTGKEALSLWLIRLLGGAYASKQERNTVFVSPVRATKEQLRALPDTVILTCEKDSVALDGKVYAQMLQEAGVPVAYRCCPGAIHGQSTEPGELGDQCRQWLTDQVKAILVKKQEK